MAEPFADLAAFTILMVGRTVKLIGMKVIIDQMCANTCESIAKRQNWPTNENKRVHAAAQAWVDKSWHERLVSIPPLLTAMKH